LSSHRSEQSEIGSWKIDIADAIVTGVGRNEIIIEIPDQRTLILFTEDEASHDAWMEALQRAASRKLDVFYALGKEIGRGPFTAVRLATHKKSCKHYAVKTINKQAHSINFVETELKSMKVVEHQNLVRIVDIYDTKDRIYVVSEYMRGGTLYDVIGRNRAQFTEATAAHVMREILKAVAYLHKEGFCHRNIKPSNLLCSNASFPETVRVSDYGWVAFMEKACEIEDYFDSDIRTRTLLTTPHFVAPEILFGTQGYGQAVDLWSCGVVLYSILSGKLPFEGKDKKEVIESIQKCQNGPDFPPEQWDCISDEAKDIVLGLLKIKPSTRLTAAAALGHPWISADKSHLAPIKNELQNLSLMPSFCLAPGRATRLVSVDSGMSQHSAEGTFTITSETRKKMSVAKSKIMYNGGQPVKNPDPLMTSSSDGQPGRRSSRGLSRNSRGMSRLSRGLKKGTQNTFGLFRGKNPADGPSEYW